MPETPQGPSLVDSSTNRRMLKKRMSTVSFRDTDDYVVLDQHGQEAASPMNDNSQGSSTSGRSIKSIFARRRRRSSVRLKSLVEDDDEDDDTDRILNAPFGFVDGDFHTGKTLDLMIRGGCFVMQQHNSILAVGLLNGDGVALYETTTYTLMCMLPQSDAVSALEWLSIDDNTALLAVGCLNGTVSVYTMQPDLVELQGADLLHELRLDSQVRSMSLGVYRGALDDEEILLAVGCKSGALTFTRLMGDDCNAVETKTVHVHDSAILGIAMTASGSLIATCTRAGRVLVSRVQQRNDDASFYTLGHDVYATQRAGAVRTIVFLPTRS